MSLAILRNSFLSLFITSSAAFPALSAGELTKKCSFTLNESIEGEGGNKDKNNNTVTSLINNNYLIAAWLSWLCRGDNGANGTHGTYNHP